LNANNYPSFFWSICPTKLQINTPYILLNQRLRSHSTDSSASITAVKASCSCKLSFPWCPLVYSPVCIPRAYAMSTSHVSHNSGRFSVLSLMLLPSFGVFFFHSNLFDSLVFIFFRVSLVLVGVFLHLEFSAKISFCSFEGAFHSPVLSSVSYLFSAINMMESLFRSGPSS